MDSRYVIVLSGTPASGKDTITTHLSRLEPVFIDGEKWTFSAIKKDKLAFDVCEESSDPRNALYNLVDANTFQRKIEDGTYIQYHRRYQSGYAVSMESLQAAWDDRKIPIIHNGKQENLPSFYQAGLFPFCVLLMCGKEETESRLKMRQANRPDEWEKRLAAYWEERQEIGSAVLSGERVRFHAAFSTDNLSAFTVARMLRSSAALYWQSAIE